MISRSLQVLLTLIVFSLVLVAPAHMQDSFYNEAPMLAERVAAGELPAVAERLPMNPLLVTPNESVGVYGGTWNMAMVGLDGGQMFRTMGYENLVRWDSAWTKVIPNLAQSFEISEDSRVFTFHLREGLKWSDGTSYTSDALMFWYEASFLNPEAYERTVPFWLKVGQDNLVVEAPDDYTVIFRFTEPQGLFIKYMATFDGGNLIGIPRHFMSQFHPDYNPNIDAVLAASGFETWQEMWALKMWIVTPELPTMNAWILDPSTFNEDGTPMDVIRAVRNPYYWKIDTEFNQLPYIDQIEFTVVDARDDILPLVLAGEVDMQDRNIPIEVSEPENQAQGGYGIYTVVPTGSNVMAITFNQTIDDPVKREIFQNRSFRIGLSHAINRNAIIEAMGLEVSPRQVAPLEGSPFFSEQMATQYLEYDVDLANQYLDEAGFTQRNADGIRLGPDGNPIQIRMLIPTPFIYVDNLPLYLSQIQSDWRAVGVDLQLEELPRTDVEARWTNNDFEVTFWVGEGGYEAIMSPRHYVPTVVPWSLHGILWARWYLDPTDLLAEAPPANVQELQSLYEQIATTADADEQFALMEEVIQMSAENFDNIGIHEMPLSYGVIRPNFHNVPTFMYAASIYPNPAPTNPSQYYIDPVE